jgi:pyruvate-ferredoxin/flavodoxin oxidoreductase
VSPGNGASWITRPVPPAVPAPQADDDGGYTAPWIETPSCSACEECIRINPRIFGYNSAGKAIIKDPDAGPYSDLVKAAERCKEGIIHPGVPRDRSSPEVQRWIARGAKYN